MCPLRHCQCNSLCSYKNVFLLAIMLHYCRYGFFVDIKTHKILKKFKEYDIGKDIAKRRIKTFYKSIYFKLRVLAG